MLNREYDIISAGLMVCDIIASPLDATVFERDTTHLHDIDFLTGGDALNVAFDASKLGMRVCIGGTVGNDMAGNFILSQADAQGITHDCINYSSKSKTSTSVILRSEDGDRHFAFYAGANAEFDGSMITDDMLKNSKMLYIGSMMGLDALAGEPLADLFRRAHACGTITAMDATSSSNNVWLPKIESALPHTDIFIPSISEAQKICGTDVPQEIVSFLAGRGVKIAGVKLGKEGVYVGGEYLPAFECDNVVDTTGAGDGFMSGFCTGYIKGMSVRDAALLGSAVSNFCIKQVGATAGTKNYEETKQLADYYNNKLFSQK